MTPLRPGSVVDRYLVLRPIGSGGAAQVYAVRHTVLDTVHALKVLRLGGAAARERLVREGRVQARLDPAHVVPVTDVIDVFGAPALVLPLVDGCSLDVALADRRPTLDEATALFRAIVDGVACAHRVGVVHRDLKPSNVLLDRVGERVRVRVADFGIAKAGELGRPDPPTADGVGAAAGSTQGFVGTPAYAAPEQLGHAGQAEAPADVWSLGVILHELTTGARPSPEGPPVPPPLDGLARALLRPDPAERPSIGWVAEALDALGVPDALGPGSALSTWLGAHRVSVAASTPAPEVERTVRLPSRMERLPADRDPFVGRAAELDALDAQLRLARWVTLTGIGGVGKTRLALAAARRFAGEGIVADLTEARSVADLGHALARALDVPLGAGDPVEGIGGAIAGRGRCLIVLDGFEGVSGGADAVERWVHATTATFLVTSRVRVASRAEQVVALGPLTSPDAARLFVARARAAGGQVDDDDPAIPELVELLDAHPLALELAAARTGVLSPKGLVSRMTDRFRLLVAPRGSHTAHRWATLRAVLDWSWSALADDERAALLELSVFAGGFELPAAEQVLAPAGGWAIDLVQALVHASLVRTLGDGRFELLHSVREFAREQAAADPARDRAAKDRHAAWFARLGADEALEALELRADHRRALQRELPNLTAACADAIARGEAEVAARTAMAAWHAVWLTGPPTAGVLLLEGALAAGPDPFTAARLRLHAGMAHLLAGDPRAARAHTEASRDGFRSPRWLALAIGQLGVLDHRDGNLDVALTSYQRALALTREVGNRAHEGSLLRNIALIAATRGQVDEAVHTLSRALELHLAAGDVRNAALTRTALAWRLVSIHALESAEDQLRDALEAFREIGDRRHVGLTLGELGVVAYLRGDLDRAFTSCTEALATHRAVGDRRNVGQELGTLASLALARGDTERAEQWLDQALVSHRSIGARGLEARDRTNLAGMRLRAGDPAGARRAAEQALELACAVGNRTIEGEVCLVLASIARIDGDLTEGRRWHGRASGLASGLPELTGAVACADGELAWAEGRLDAAREALTRGIRDARDPAQRAAALGRLAAVERSRGDLDAAERAAAAHEQAAGALRAGPRSSARWVG